MPVPACERLGMGASLRSYVSRVYVERAGCRATVGWRSIFQEVALAGNWNNVGEWVKNFLIAAVAAVLAVVGSAYLQDRQQQINARSLASALAGEMSAVIKYEIVSADYLEGLLATLRRGEDWKPVDRPPERNFMIYEGNAQAIGILGNQYPGQIAEFYGLANRLREHVRFLGSEFGDLSQSDKLFWLEKTIEAQRKWTANGFSIVRELAEFAKVDVGFPLSVSRKVEGPFVSSVWVTALATIIAALLSGWAGASFNNRKNIKRERQNRKQEKEDVTTALYQELADRVARCLNDYLSPWKGYYVGDSITPMQVHRLQKFRPADLVVYPQLAGKLGLVDTQALGRLIHFYFRLDAIRRDIDRWNAADRDLDLYAAGHTKLMGLRFAESLKPALEALEALGSKLPDHEKIDDQVSAGYSQIAANNKGLIEQLRELTI